MAVIIPHFYPFAIIVNAGFKNTTICFVHNVHGAKVSLPNGIKEFFFFIRQQEERIRCSSTYEFIFLFKFRRQIDSKVVIPVDSIIAWTNHMCLRIAAAHEYKSATALTLNNLKQRCIAMRTYRCFIGCKVPVHWNGRIYTSTVLISTGIKSTDGTHEEVCSE